jgi:HEAT repeat protein
MPVLTMLRPCAICFLVTSLFALAACEDWGEKNPTRDFNELIPRFMGAANKGSPEEAAANLFNVTNPDERRDAIAYLQTKPYGHEPPYMRAYETLTTDPHPLVRAQAMRALGTSHQQRAVPFLLKGLNDKEATVRRDAAIGLTNTYGGEATAPLTEHVRADVDEQVRINSARALRWANTQEGIRALIDALEDRDAAVVYSARQSLQAITHQDFGYDNRAWLTWYNETYNQAAPATAPTIAR